MVEMASASVSKMQGALFKSIEEGIQLVEVNVPNVQKSDDVIIGVKACGMCGTDLAILEGRHHSRPPVILGHECAGEVMQIGKDVKSLSVGDHVVVDSSLRCGVCRYC